MSEINVGVVGLGTVGGGVVKLLAQRGEDFRRQYNLRLARVADTNSKRFAELPVGDAKCDTDASAMLEDPNVNVIVELVGGTGFARQLVLRALERGKHVVTANKALIAEHGPELFAAAEAKGVSLWFEASVGGGIPIIKVLREALAGNRIRSVQTIINGTCNYILTSMARRGMSFEDALAEAQARGYAEADPTLDVGGGDTGHKLAITASLVAQGYVPFDKIAIEGITSITREDIAFAEALGYSIKLLGIVHSEEHGFDVRVHPTMLSKSHILASVHDVFNAMRIEGDAVGEILLYGRGAGEMPTASAVTSDLLDVARSLAVGSAPLIGMGFYRKEREVPVRPLSAVRSRYYLRFTVADRPGVVAKIATALSNEGISIASIMQRETPGTEPVPVVFVTHLVEEAKVRAALVAIEKQDFVAKKTQLLHIED